MMHGPAKSQALRIAMRREISRHRGQPTRQPLHEPARTRSPQQSTLQQCTRQVHPPIVAQARNKSSSQKVAELPTNNSGVSSVASRGNRSRGSRGIHSVNAAPRRAGNNRSGVSAGTTAAIATLGVGAATKLPLTPWTKERQALQSITMTSTTRPLPSTNQHGG
mmetsp:Transcript_4510/g.10190  ORF Transcript_4510/g.10190 Transcript_4510/m.10190 type:complete len:164 (+) Transcript_4510:43-534(+)